MIVTLLPNYAGRDFILGDLHGAYDSLQALLEFVHFEPEKDRLIAVGDLFDRGIHPHQCASLLDCAWFHSVQGNHEESLLAWFASQDRTEREHHELKIRAQGGDWFFTLPDENKTLLCQKIAQLPLVILFTHHHQTYCVLHAEIPPETHRIESFLQSLMARDIFALNACIKGRRRHSIRSSSSIQGIDFVTAGHTPVPPTSRYKENCLNLDFGLPLTHPYSALGMLDAGSHQLYLCNPQHEVCLFQDC